jgi:hypothetical protein
LQHGHLSGPAGDPDQAIVVRQSGGHFAMTQSPAAKKKRKRQTT